MSVVGDKSSGNGGDVAGPPPRMRIRTTLKGEILASFEGAKKKARFGHALANALAVAAANVTVVAVRDVGSSKLRKAVQRKIAVTSLVAVPRDEIKDVQTTIETEWFGETLADALNHVGIYVSSRDVEVKLVEPYGGRSGQGRFRSGRGRSGELGETDSEEDAMGDGFSDASFRNSPQSAGTDDDADTDVRGTTADSVANMHELEMGLAAACAVLGFCVTFASLRNRRRQSMVRWGASRGGTASNAAQHRTAVQLRRANDRWSSRHGRDAGGGGGGGDRRPSYDSFMSAVNEEETYADAEQEGATGPSG